MIINAERFTYKKTNKCDAFSLTSALCAHNYLQTPLLQYSHDSHKILAQVLSSSSHLCTIFLVNLMFFK